jgi:hypothetical protein
MKIQVLSVADVKFAIGILEDVKPKDKQKLAPEVGLEPTTNRLTADRSTTELLRNCLKVKRKPKAEQTKKRGGIDNRLIPTTSALNY